MPELNSFFVKNCNIAITPQAQEAYRASHYSLCRRHESRRSAMNNNNFTKFKRCICADTVEKLLIYPDYFLTRDLDFDLISKLELTGYKDMMGEQEAGLNQQSQDFCLEQHIAKDHILRHIDSLLDFSDIKEHLKDYYSHTGRPSVAPELMVRMLLIGYCYGIRSERRLCDEVNYNLAYRWFCKLGLSGQIPNHATFSKNRHGRFRDSDLFRFVFEAVVKQCIAAGLVNLSSV